MKIVHLDTLEKTPVDMEGASKAFKQTPISSADGAPNFSFRVFSLEPEGHTPYHEHPFEHLNYVIAGEGALVDADGTEHKMGAGSFAFVKPGERHQYRNVSEGEPFVMICAVPVEYE